MNCPNSGNPCLKFECPAYLEGKYCLKVLKDKQDLGILYPEESLFLREMKNKRIGVLVK